MSTVRYWLPDQWLRPQRVHLPCRYAWKDARRSHAIVFGCLKSDVKRRRKVGRSLVVGERARWLRHGRRATIWDFLKWGSRRAVPGSFGALPTDSPQGRFRERADKRTLVAQTSARAGFAFAQFYRRLCSVDDLLFLWFLWLPVFFPSPVVP